MRLLFICIILSFSFTINAQDSSNDATWEETIEFLKKHQNKIESVQFYFRIRNQKLKIMKTDDFNLSSSNSSFEFEDDKKGSKFSYNFNLANSLSYIISSGNQIGLSFTSERSSDISYESWSYMYSKNFLAKENNYKISNFRINYKENSEFIPRAKKAWKHLAYLATKKRKEEHKASGDKF